MVCPFTQFIMLSSFITIPPRGCENVVQQKIEENGTMSCSLLKKYISPLDLAPCSCVQNLGVTRPISTLHWVFFTFQRLNLASRIFIFILKKGLLEIASLSCDINILVSDQVISPRLTQRMGLDAALNIDKLNQRYAKYNVA